MKKLATLIAVSALATSAYASDNPDQYGWVLDDPTPAVDHTAQAGVNDNYGSVLLDDTPAFSTAPAELGIGDDYGSILNDIEL